MGKYPGDAPNRTSPVKTCTCKMKTTLKSFCQLDTHFSKALKRHFLPGNIVPSGRGRTVENQKIPATTMCNVVRVVLDSAECLPTELSRAVFVDEGLVVRAESLRVGQVVGLGVQVKLVELQNPREHLGVLLVLPPLVLLLLVPRVETVEADHVEALLGDRAPVSHKNIVPVLVMSIRHGHVREAAARLVHSVHRGVDRVVPVRIFLQKFGKCDLFRELASERKGVTNNSPLALTEDAENFGAEPTLFTATTGTEEYDAISLSTAAARRSPDANSRSIRVQISSAIP